VNRLASRALSARTGKIEAPGKSEAAKECSMFEDQSGWMWLLLNVIAVAILGAAIIYGTMQWRKRRKSRGLQQARDNATDRLYHKQ
jgi:hypothetical protein